MGSKMTTRKLKSIETRARIQRAALNLFEKNGFENVSVEDIAHAAGCSVGNIYHYFKGKEQLALQVVYSVDVEYSKLNEIYAADTSRSAKEKLLDFVEKAIMICTEDEFIFMGIIHGIKYPEQGVLKFRPDRPYFAVLLKLLYECQEEGSIGKEHDIMELLEYFSVSIRGTIIEWRLNEGRFDVTTYGRRLATSLLKGLKP